MKPLWWLGQRDSPRRWKENAQKGDEEWSPKAETGRTSISACNRTLASARHTDKLCYQSRTNQLYSLHCAFMHETSSRFWANFRPPSSVPPAIRLELLFRAINARRYAGQEDNSEKCFGRILYDRSDLAAITRF